MVIGVCGCCGGLIIFLNASNSSFLSTEPSEFWSMERIASRLCYLVTVLPMPSYPNKSLKKNVSSS